MDKQIKRSYYLPGKLVEIFDSEAKRQGYIRERAVAAAIASFLKSDPVARAGMFEYLDQLRKGKAK